MLVAGGADVRAMCLYNSFGHHGWLDFIDERIRSQVELFFGDVRDPFRTGKAMEGIECVFHLASLIAIPYSYLASRSYVSTNVTGTLNVLQAARDRQVAKFIHTSTSEVYGTAQYVPIDEKHPLVGQSPYAASKIGADQLALSFHRSFDLPVTIIRPFNTYGPRQSTRAIIPTIICQLAAGETAIQLGNLSPTRDFTFVGDLCEAFAAIASADRSVGEVVNIGSGQEISIGDLAYMIGRVMNKDITISEDSRRVRPAASEVERLLCDNSRADEWLNWKPSVRLEAGLKQTAEWFAEGHNLSGYQFDRYHI